MKNFRRIVIVLIITAGLFLSQYQEILYAFDYNRTYEVFINGESVGYVSNRELVEEALAEKRALVEEEYITHTIYEPLNYNVMTDISFIAKDTKDEEIKKLLLEKLDFRIDGYVVTVTPNLSNLDTYASLDFSNEIYEFPVASIEVFESAFNDFLKLYLNDVELELINNGQEYIKPDINEITVTDYHIAADISYVSEVVSISNIYSRSALNKRFLFGEDYEVEEYIVQPGDSIAKIALENQIPSEDIVYANESITSTTTLLAQGEVLNIIATEPIVYVFTNEYEVNEYKLDYDIIYEEDPTRYVTDDIVVKQKGQTGLKVEEHSKVKINGTETAVSVQLSSNVTLNPVDEVLVKGTKPVPVTSYGGNSYNLKNYLIPPEGALTGTGVWARPSKGYISSGWGWRRRSFHDALDYAGQPRGTANTAADSGYVVFVGYYAGGAGHHVVIDHGNGYYSRYSHCEPGTLVSVGTNIHKGEKVCGVGDSGYATGIHLHFQIMDSNLTRINPLTISSVFK